MAYSEVTAAPPTANTITATYAVTANHVGTGAIAALRLCSYPSDARGVSLVEATSMEIQALNGASSECWASNRETYST